jgi:hypothetical protein
MIQPSTTTIQLLFYFTTQREDDPVRDNIQIQISKSGNNTRISFAADASRVCRYRSLGRSAAAAAESAGLPSLPVRGAVAWAAPVVVAVQIMLGCGVAH